MQAIQTKYYGPSNVRGSRIIARAAAGSVIVGYDHRIDIEENHKAAAHALAVKLDWLSDAYGTLVTGSLPDGSYVHVFTLTRDSAAHNPVVALLDSADDTGCDGDLIVVSRTALRAVADIAVGESPTWLLDSGEG